MRDAPSLAASLGPRGAAAAPRLSRGRRGAPSRSSQSARLGARPWRSARARSPRRPPPRPAPCADRRGRPRRRPPPSPPAAGLGGRGLAAPRARPAAVSGGLARAARRHRLPRCHLKGRFAVLVVVIAAPHHSPSPSAPSTRAASPARFVTPERHPLGRPSPRSTAGRSRGAVGFSTPFFLRSQEAYTPPSLRRFTPPTGAPPCHAPRPARLACPIVRSLASSHALPLLASCFLGPVGLPTGGITSKPRSWVAGRCHRDPGRCHAQPIGHNIGAPLPDTAALVDPSGPPWRARLPGE
jgi:hypothetical protein